MKVNIEINCKDLAKLEDCLEYIKTNTLFAAHLFFKDHPKQKEFTEYTCEELNSVDIKINK